MSERRNVTPEELEAIFRLAVQYPDLRVVAEDIAYLNGLRARYPNLAADLADLDALRARVARGEAAMKGLARSQVELRAAVAAVPGHRPEQKWTLAKT